MIEKLILAIDTSCDDTSVAVTKGFEVWSSVVASQVELHRPYGGVFPTVAKLAHQEKIGATIDLALKRAGVERNEIAGIAVTAGPGLAPALEVGVRTAKELARKWGLPLIAVNHIEAHLWSGMLRGQGRNEEEKRQDRDEAKEFCAEERQGQDKMERSGVKEWRSQDETKKSDVEKWRSQDEIRYPFLGMVMSGGHSQFIMVNGKGKYEIIGETLDDAGGECLDKIGRMLNLGYPAGPVMEKLAEEGDAGKYRWPLPLTERKDFDLSFSGLKTHGRHLIAKVKGENEVEDELTAEQIKDLAAGAQEAVFRHIIYKLNKLLLVEKMGKIGLKKDERENEQKNVSAGKKAKIETKNEMRGNIGMGLKIENGNEISGNIEAELKETGNEERLILLGGGVAANITLRRKLRKFLRDFNQKYETQWRLVVPRKKSWCGDNAAMIGAVAGWKLMRGEVVTGELERRPEWRLGED